MATDEIHQFYVPGRAFQVSDILWPKACPEVI
jgi:VanZ family protein